MPVNAPASHRRRQAQATRELIAASARRLFADAGYVGTTIEGISQAAAIPVPTIYSAFGNKAAILEEVRRLWIAESDVEDLHRRALLEPDPAKRLRLAAHWTRRQFDLGHDVIAVYQEAARADPRVGAVWQAVMRGREAAIRQLLTSMKPRLTRPRALDIYVACTVLEPYRTLVLERGWTSPRYERWLGDLLVREIIN